MKQFFNKGLYWEGIRQSTLVGIIMTSIMMLGAIFTPLGYFAAQFIQESATGSVPQKILVDGTSYNAVISVVFILFAPILSLVLYSFLNKRNTSDFYHSLSHKRETLFGSYFLAMITWLVGAMLLCTITSGILYAIFMKYVMVNVTSVLVMLFNMFAASVLVAAVTTMVMAITGTGFTNVIVGLLVLFLPRLLLVVFTSLIQSTSQIVPIEAFGILGDVSYNIPANLIFGLFTNPLNYTNMFTNWVSGLYTLILGLLYLAAAFILFKKRKSEVAGTSAPNRILQNIYRVAVSFVICLIPCSLLVAMITGQYSMEVSAATLVGVATLYGLALIVYFAYELITTRKFVNLLKALPALGVLVLLNVLFVGGVLGANSVILNVKLDAANIAAVQLRSKNTYSYESTQTYESLMAGNIKLTDTELNTIIANSLKATQEAVKNNSYSDQYTTQSVVIYRKAGRALYRNIRISAEDQTKLTATLAKNQKYRDAILNLPADNVSVYFNGSAVLTDEQLDDIYATLRAEVKEMDFETWYNLLNNSVMATSEGDMLSSASTDYSFSIYVTGSIGVENFSSTYTITTATPQTFMKMINYVNVSQRAEGIAALNNYKAETEDYNISISAYGFQDAQGNSIDGSMYYYSYSGINAAEKQASAIPAAVLTQLKADNAQYGDQPVDITKPFYKIDVNITSNAVDKTSYDSTEYSSYSFFINASTAVPLFTLTETADKV